MPIFHFSLESLLTVRRHLRDKERQQLADIQRRDFQLLGRRHALAAACARHRDALRLLRAPGKIDVWACTAAEWQLKDLEKEFVQIDHERTLLAVAMEQRRRAARDADMAVTALERLSEKQRLAFEAEEIRRETLRQEDDWRNANSSACALLGRA